MRDPIPVSTLDRILASQLIVAWAGETGDPDDTDGRRLGWWRADLTNEFGGGTFFEDLIPNTAKWAALQAAREAARRHDDAQRTRSADPDQLVTLFRLGARLDERLDLRLLELKRRSASPQEALPLVAELVNEDDWSAHDFQEWLAAQARPGVEVEPAGRRVRGAPSKDAGQTVNQLLAALAPLAESWPMPHFRAGRA